MSIGWGIVSLGRHATNKMAPAINAASDGKLAAVYSRNMRIAEEFAEHHSAGTAYDTVDALLNDPNVDAVYVSSPNALHHQQTVQAARAGKHVLCEKPMALTVEDCEEMIDVCERARVRLGLCFHARHHPLIQGSPQGGTRRHLGYRGTRGGPVGKWLAWTHKAPYA